MKSSFTGLLIIDWQERLAPAMPATLYQQALHRATTLKWLFESLNLPIYTTEQYPRGLGETVVDLQPVEAMPKTTFSIMADNHIFNQLMLSNTKHFFVVGMETHICVYQSAIDLLEHGKEITVCSNACMSRKKIDWKTALADLQLKGANIKTAEMILFDLIKDAKHPLFKELSRRIKQF